MAAIMTGPTKVPTEHFADGFFGPADADARAAEHVADLRWMLDDMGLPPLRDLTTAGEGSAPPASASDAAASGSVIGSDSCPLREGWPTTTSVLLTHPSERWAALTEGGRLLPGGVVLAFSPTWLEKRPIGETLGGGKGKDGEGEGEGKGGDGGIDTHVLHVKRGVWCDRDGQCYLSDFQPARRVTYFANFFTRAASYGERSDGSRLERGLHVPTSSSEHLEQVTGDKLMTRLLLARAQVAVPCTLAFPRDSDETYAVPPGVAISVRHVKSDTPVAELEPKVLTAVERFVKRYRPEKVVVKPSGSMWMGSKGVSFHTVAGEGSNGGIVEAVLKLMSRLYTGDSVLVEEFISTMPTQLVMVKNELTAEAVLNPGVPLAARDSAQAARILMHDYQVATDEIDPLEKSSIDVRVRLGFRLRVVVSRGAWGRPVVCKMVTGVGPANEPLHGVNTVPQSIEATLDQWGLVAEHQQREVMDVISEQSTKVMEALSENERQMPAKLRGGAMFFTDLIGIDFVLTLRHGVVLPVVIEVNDHDCCYQSQLVESVISSSAGDVVRPWLQMQMKRSVDYLMENRRLLIIGGGGYSKQFVWDCIQEHNVRVVLVDQDAEHRFRKHPSIETFVHFPELDDHTDDVGNSTKLLRLLKEKHGFTLPAWATETLDEDEAALRDAGRSKAMWKQRRGLATAPYGKPGVALDVASHNVGSFDGCITFWEDCTPVAAATAQRLGLRNHEMFAQMTAKNKLLTQQCLLSEVEDRDHRLPYTVYGARSAIINTEQQLKEVLAKGQISLPAVIKLAFGSSAVGVVLVVSEEDALKAMKRIRQDLLDPGEDEHPGSGLSFEKTMLLAEFLPGSEHDIDLVLWNGHIEYAAVSDNGPTRLPLFAETSACMPTTLHKHRHDALVTAAWHCCRAVGLTDGAINVEMKMTSSGPRLIEINGRMGGFYLRDWSRRVYGVDLCRCALAVACGIRPRVVPSPKPMTNLCGIQLYESQHRLTGLTSMENLKKIGESSSSLVFNWFEEELTGIEEFQEPAGNLAVASRESVGRAKEELLVTLRCLGLDRGDIAADWYLAYL